MQMSPERVEFPFNTVPDNIQCLKYSHEQAARKWNNEMELLIWYDWTLKGEGVGVYVKDGVITDLNSSIQIDFSI